MNDHGLISCIGGIAASFDYISGQGLHFQLMARQCTSLQSATLQTDCTDTSLDQRARWAPGNPTTLLIQDTRKLDGSAMEELF